MIVYFHRNPNTFQIFYVGIGSSIKRAKDHSLDGRNIHWHRYVKKHGRPVIQIAHENISREVAITWEIYYISLLGKVNSGGQLTNMTHGGELAENLVNYIKMFPERNPMYKPENKLLMSINNPMYDPVNREKIRIANLGKKASPETRLKQSLLKKGLPSNQPKGYKHSQQVIDRLRIINKTNANKPGVKERLRATRLGRIILIKRKKVAKIDIITNEVIKIYDCIMDANKDLGIPMNSGNISSVCAGKRNKVRGFKWAYYMD